MDSVDLTSLCASLSIGSKDGPMQLLDGDLRVDARNRFNRDWILNQWQGIFLHSIRNELDLNRVLAGCPWSFDGALIAMEKPVGKGTLDSLSFNLADFWVQIYQIPLLCMTKEIGRFLGNMIGQVLEVDGGAC
ncbi:hypothetical protein EZV62_014339 [Acer yangbiense]|uniref:Uncharacterized protein n=1 Tax=Acer yangbiense TaxID=1000413 RepID=A0A5C7HTZ1_9ROSI|nr:hypothetical protein EZV62_014339 [Acer yangbiense]